MSSSPKKEALTQHVRQNVYRVPAPYKCKVCGAESYIDPDTLTDPPAESLCFNYAHGDRAKWLADNGYAKHGYVLAPRFANAPVSPLGTSRRIRTLRPELMEEVGLSGMWIDVAPTQNAVTSSNDPVGQPLLYVQIQAALRRAYSFVLDVASTPGDSEFVDCMSRAWFFDVSKTYGQFGKIPFLKSRLRHDGYEPSDMRLQPGNVFLFEQLGLALIPCVPGYNMPTHFEQHLCRLLDAPRQHPHFGRSSTIEPHGLNRIDDNEDLDYEELLMDVPGLRPHLNHSGWTVIWVESLALADSLATTIRLAYLSSYMLKAREGESALGRDDRIDDEAGQRIAHLVRDSNRIAERMNLGGGRCAGLEQSNPVKSIAYDSDSILDALTPDETLLRERGF